jgi:hypothetical protein
MAISDEKQQSPSYNEASSLAHSHTDVLVEDEPSSIYEVKWRTIFGVVALSLANVCAAIANTVRISSYPSPILYKADLNPHRQTQQSTSRLLLWVAQAWLHGLPTRISS